ncbi:hypothetical protein WDW86_09985 [Bdellovibrionota bacterium FG-2]
MTSQRWLSLICSIVFFPLTAIAVAQEPVDPLDKPSSPASIEARTFSTTIAKQSRSAKVFLFANTQKNMPPVGRILLLKKKGEPFMAVRVLKVYSDKEQFAAKRIKRYPKFAPPQNDDLFIAIEKLSDLAAPPPSSQDNRDLQELENGDSLDAPPATPSSDTEDLESPQGVPSRRGGDEEDVDEDIEIEIDEVSVLDPHYQWLTLGMGYLRNNGAGGASTYFAAAGFRYGVTLFKMILLQKAHLQDSFALEGGLFYYKTLNYPVADEGYTVIPMLATARYNVQVKEGFGLFFYGGLIFNRVLIAGQGTEETRLDMSQMVPAAGGGVFFQVGPNWDLRFDLGFDTVGLGLTLRF